jgi:hypothetical protein
VDAKQHGDHGNHPLFNSDQLAPTLNMKYLEIAPGKKQSETLVIGNKQLATVFLPPTPGDRVTFTILTGHDTDKDNLGVLHKNDEPLTVSSHSEYSVHIFNPDDFEGAATLAFKADRQFPDGYKIWVYLHTF